jgi:hypothetical protein
MKRALTVFLALVGALVGLGIGCLAWIMAMPCRACEGAGWIIDDRLAGTGLVPWRACPMCGGRG